MVPFLWGGGGEPYLLTIALHGKKPKSTNYIFD